MKKVAVLQDLSSFGKCSLTVAIPVLSVMGTQAVPLPTAILTSQTGYDSYHCEDFTDKMHYFEDEWAKMNVSFDGIYTGFVTGEKQINNIFRFLNKFFEKDSTLLVDPVMGDNGEAYKFYTPALLDRMSALVKSAHIITPNLTETCLLTGTSYDKLQSYKSADDYMAAIHETGQKLQQFSNAKVIITGVNPPVQNGEQREIGNVFIDEETSYYNLNPYNGESYSGTGDLFASIIMGSVMRGDKIEQAVQLAETFLREAIIDTNKDNPPKVEGVHFEKFLKLLL